MDITRHLNCEPVLARPPSRLYEFQKTVRRHSFGFAAAALMTLVLVAATGISAPGTVYRMDEVPLPLRPALRSPYPTDEEVLRRICQAVAKKPAWMPGTNGPKIKV